MQVLCEAEHDVAGVAPFVADGSAGDFSFGDEDADVVFQPLVLSGNLRALEHAQELPAVGEEALEKSVERGVAGSGAVEDAVETGAQEFGALGARGELVVLQLP